MKHLFVILCIVVLLVIPASAQTATFTAPDGKALWAVHMEAPLGSTGTYTLNLASGGTITGSWSYVGYPITTAEATIGSDSDDFTYTQPLIPLPLRMQIWHGDERTIGLVNSSNPRVIRFGIGQNERVWNIVVESQTTHTYMVGYTITSDDNIVVTEETIDADEAGANTAEGVPGLPEILKGYSGLVAAVFFNLIYWLKFLFVDNLVLTVCLYLTGSMAYAINTSSNIFQFYKTWFRQQAALFNFIANAFTIVFQNVVQVASIIGQAMGTIATIAVSLLSRLI